MSAGIPISEIRQNRTIISITWNLYIQLKTSPSFPSMLVWSNIFRVIGAYHVINFVGLNLVYHNIFGRYIMRNLFYLFWFKTLQSLVRLEFQRTMCSILLVLKLESFYYIRMWFGLFWISKSKDFGKSKDLYSCCDVLSVISSCKYFGSSWFFILHISVQIFSNLFA